MASLDRNRFSGSFFSARIFSGKPTSNPVTFNPYTTRWFWAALWVAFRKLPNPVDLGIVLENSFVGNAPRLIRAFSRWTLIFFQKALLFYCFLTGLLTNQTAKYQMIHKTTEDTCKRERERDREREKERKERTHSKLHHKSASAPFDSSLSLFLSLSLSLSHHLLFALSVLCRFLSRSG